jgi:hypothetical protein
MTVPANFPNAPSSSRKNAWEIWFEGGSVTASGKGKVGGGSTWVELELPPQAAKSSENNIKVDDSRDKTNFLLPEPKSIFRKYGTNI